MKESWKTAMIWAWVSLVLGGGLMAADTPNLVCVNWLGFILMTIAFIVIASNMEERWFRISLWVSIPICLLIFILAGNAGTCIFSLLNIGVIITLFVLKGHYKDDGR